MLYIIILDIEARIQEIACNWEIFHSIRFSSSLCWYEPTETLVTAAFYLVSV